MTDQERIQSILSELEYGYIGYGNMHEDDDQGLKVIEKALNKTVPMKPIGKSEGYDEFFEIFYLECPMCGNRVAISDVDDFDEDLIDEFCSRCGQKISKEYMWEEELTDGEVEEE